MSFLRPGSSSMARPGTSSGARRNFDSVSGTSSLLSTADSYSMTLQREMADDSLMRILNKDKNFEVTQMMRFVEKGQIKQINKSVEKYPDILSCKGTDGFTALHYACKFGHITLILKLLSLEHYCSDLKGMESDVSINAQTDSGETSLHLAAYENRMYVVDVLLQHRGIDINSVNKDNETALFYAVRRNNVQMVEQLLLKGIDHTIEDCCGERAIEHSTSQECTDAFNIVNPKSKRTLLRNGSGGFRQQTDLGDQTRSLQSELLTHIHSYLGHRDRDHWWCVNKQWRAVCDTFRKTYKFTSPTAATGNCQSNNSSSSSDGNLSLWRKSLEEARSLDRQHNALLSNHGTALPAAPSTSAASSIATGRPPVDPGNNSSVRRRSFEN
jgi:ankyrin repeat protein